MLTFTLETLVTYTFFRHQKFPLLSIGKSVEFPFGDTIIFSLVSAGDENLREKIKEKNHIFVHNITFY